MVQLYRCECGAEHHADNCPANWWSEEVDRENNWKEIEQEDKKILRHKANRAALLCRPASMSEREAYQLIYSTLSTDMLFDQMHPDWSMPDMFAYLSLRIARAGVKK